MVSIRFGPSNRFCELAHDRKHEHLIHYEKQKHKADERRRWMDHKRTTNERNVVVARFNRPKVEEIPGSSWSVEEMRALISLLGQADVVVSSGWTPFLSCLSDDTCTAWCSRSEGTTRTPTMPQNTSCYSLLDPSHGNAINTYKVAVPAKLKNKYGHVPMHIPIRIDQMPIQCA